MHNPSPLAAEPTRNHPHPHFTALHTQLAALCDTSAVRDSLLGLATLLAACTRLRMRDTPQRQRVRGAGIWSARTALRLDYAHRRYQAHHGNIHDTINQIADDIGDSDGGDGRALAHRAAADPNLTLCLTVTDDPTVAFFAAGWPSYREKTIAVIWGPSVLADTTHHLGATHTFHIDPAVVTDEFLRTCYTCAAATSTPFRDRDPLPTAINTAVALRR
jgi:hypothetical protein